MRKFDSDKSGNRVSVTLDSENVALYMLSDSFAIITESHESLNCERMGTRTERMEAQQAWYLFSFIIIIYIVIRSEIDLSFQSL